MGREMATFTRCGVSKNGPRWKSHIIYGRVREGFGPHGETASSMDPLQSDSLHSYSTTQCSISLLKNQNSTRESRSACAQLYHKYFSRVRGYFLLALDFPTSPKPHLVHVQSMHPRVGPHTCTNTLFVSLPCFPMLSLYSCHSIVGAPAVRMHMSYIAPAIHTIMQQMEVTHPMGA